MMGIPCFRRGSGPGRGSDPDFRPATVEEPREEEETSDHDFAHEADPDAGKSPLQVDSEEPAGGQSQAVAGCGGDEEGRSSLADLDFDVYMGWGTGEVVRRYSLHLDL